MSSKEEWCADKLSKLLKEELRISTLVEMKDHLKSIPQDEIKSMMKFLDLPLVFDCLNDTNTEQIDLACDVLSSCLDNLTIGESASKYGIPLERALMHPHPPVKIIILKELERNVKNDDVLIDLSKRTSLLICIVNCLGSEEIAVAKRATNILFILGCSDFGIKQLTSHDLINTFNDLQQKNEISRLRVFELFVDISKESRSSFQTLNAAGLISPFLADLNNNDVLLRLNIIEILSQFATCEYGFEYLETEQIMNHLLKMLDDNDPLNLQLIEPGVLKFFGNVGHFQPKKIVQMYPSAIRRMFEHLKNSDFILIGVSLDAISFIALTSDGKCALDSLGLVEQGISTISHKMAFLSSDLTIRCLKWLNNLMQSDEANPQISSLCRKWYFTCNDTLTDIILKYSKNPFSEFRLAGFHLIFSISQHLWGQEIIKATPGFIEFLLDRDAETHKECKEIKYLIVKSLSQSTVFDQQILRRFNDYVKEGPFYVQGIMEVAFERNE